MNFIVAVDGSEPSERALDHALTIVEPLGAHVTVVHSVEPHVLVEGGEEPVSGAAEAGDRIFAESLEDAEIRAEEVLEAAAERARDAGVEATTELLYGDPVESIPEYAKDAASDGIFVGHRGLDERYEGLVGSVAKELVERATCPVTVVR
ncbi:universal stress protein [Haloferax larsenii]|uniref:Universal stress protein n=1 Tax=Haloferax larsenii TaxID=302484 RepID=A0ABY5RHP9_HALLR|nr:universal stress protein [Haloferax larsenii]ELZ75207.1 UspA domain-containing protein [Haloferax larsenii JCM 13917]UVE51565.1 universal stress protein [Haloferax larsenii]